MNEDSTVIKGYPETEYIKTLGRVESQALRSNGVWTEYASGAGILRPYKVDENGERYVDLFPNDPI